MQEESKQTESQTTTTEQTATTMTQETPSQNTSETSALADLGLGKTEKVKNEEVKTEEVKTEETKPVESPTEYEIALSDKSPLSEKDLDDVVELAQKYKWTKEEAEAYIAKKEDAYNRGAETLRNKAIETLKAEKEKFLADPDFKGEKLKSSLETIDLVVSKYGSPELAAYLKGPGGNSLPLAKMLLKIGSLMKQDTIQGKGVSSGTKADNTVEAALQNMYPNFFE